MFLYFLVRISLVFPVGSVRVGIAELGLVSLSPCGEVLLEVFPDSLVVLVGTVSPEVEAVLSVLGDAVGAGMPLDFTNASSTMLTKVSDSTSASIVVIALVIISCCSAVHCEWGVQMKANGKVTGVVLVSWPIGCAAAIGA
jgi:hypothetical protein